MNVEPQPRPRFRALARRHYVLSVLFLAYVVNVMDRNILAAVIEPVSVEFGLTDTQLGFLGGIAFALVYATFGIPIAIAADNGNRRSILAAAVAVWSMMTALTGAASGFGTLLLARVGVGIGESGGTPPSHSLIADYYGSDSRAMALSIYSLGVPVGIALGNLVGGWGNEWFGWRITFVAVGALGLLLAVLIRATVHEPLRPIRTRPTTESRPTPSNVSNGFRSLWSQTSFRHICVAASLHAFSWYGGSVWNNAFLMRSHSMTTGEAGSWLALFALLGVVGILSGGFLSDRMSTATGNPRWHVWVPGLATLGIFPFKLAAYLAGDLRIVIPSFAAMVILGSFFFGPSYAMAQGLASQQSRALAASVLLFVQTLVGLGLGPLLVGWISDALEPSAGSDSLAYGLVVVGLVNFWSAFHYFQAGRTLRGDLSRWN